jgi:purine-binding chemotaxis protein CheW
MGTTSVGAETTTVGSSAVQGDAGGTAPAAAPAPGPLDALVARLDAQFGASPLAQVVGAGRLAKRREAASQTKCLVLNLARTRIAIRMENVLEIQTPPPITPIPNVPSWLLGVTNLRGEIVSTVDLRGYLGMEVRPIDQDKRVVVVRSLKDELTTGLVVDRVEGIRGLPLDRIGRPSIDLPERLAPFVIGLMPQEGGVLVVVDVEKLLLSPEMRQFEPN